MSLIQTQLHRHSRQVPAPEQQHLVQTLDVLDTVSDGMRSDDDQSHGQELDREEDMVLAMDSSNSSRSEDALPEGEDFIENAIAQNLNISQERNNIDDAVQMYLREMGRVPLLTAEQEIQLGRSIERARIEQMRAQTRNVTPSSMLLADGENAQRRLIEANLRLVVSIARKYAGHGMSLLDLIQEGNIGLIAAAEKFDYTKGNRFATYATWSIRHAITRALANQARAIRLPVYLIEHLQQMNTVSRNLLQVLGREPTPEEIAGQMQISTEKLNEFRHVMQEPLSLEMPVGEENETSMSDLIEDQSSLSLGEVLDQQALREQIASLWQNLNERERMVIQLRFGFLDGKSYTLEEAGQVLHVTRERVRQIEVRALKKLRAADHINQLQDFLN